MRRHLYEIDLMRACIILGVVCVHSTSTFNVTLPSTSMLNPVFGGLITSFHFTREAFMFITGLVLFYTYYNKTFTAPSFWMKRLQLIAVPYIAWTVIYVLFISTYQHNVTWQLGPLFHQIGTDLLTGNQFFLYYLLLSMQLYVVFPWMVKILKRTERYHLQIFIGSFLVEIALMAFNQFVLQSTNVYHLPPVIRQLDHYRDRFILTYQFWFIAGALTAIHYDTVRAWVEKNGRTLLWTGGVMLLLLWVHYGFDRFVLGEPESMNELVLQPIMIPYSFMVAISLWRLGNRFAAARVGREHQTLYRGIEFFAKASFGIFLVHPIVMHYVYHFVVPSHVSHYLMVPVLILCIAVIYLVSGVVAYGIGRVPWVSYIVGVKTRSWQPRKVLMGKTARSH